MKAFDADEDSYGKITYKISQQNYLPKPFKINKITGVITSSFVIGMIQSIKLYKHVVV